MSDKIEDLVPEVQDLCLTFLQNCARAGFLMRVTQTKRTLDEQAALYLQGRRPGDERPIVTHAPPGYSAHNFGRAFDVCAVGSQPYPEADTFWDRVGEIGEALGLEWGGKWKFRDRPHFEFLGGKTLAQYREAAKAEGLLA